MIRVILLGYMGSGKTTLGRQLAMSLGVTFYDLDWYIETRYHTSVPQLFKERGEDTFRELERNMLHEVAEFEDVIISCGGGTPCFYDNMEYMNSLAETIYLKASPEVLTAHLKMRRIERPLLTGKSGEELLQYIQEMVSEREKYYLQAKHVLNVDLLDNFEKIQESVELLRKELGV